MREEARTASGDLPAGGFATWVQAMQRALRGEGETDVPCDGCTACCSSSQFVPIGPDEVETLARIPPSLLFPAPRRPAGHMILGYDERGRCPMLTDHGCSIYEFRPRTCRTYDCRIFPATGLTPPEADKALIAQRVRRWRFDFPTATDTAEHDAVRAAAAFLATHGELFPDGTPPVTTTALAVVAVEVHHLFAPPARRSGRAGPDGPDRDKLRATLARRAVAGAGN